MGSANNRETKPLSVEKLAVPSFIGQTEILKTLLERLQNSCAGNPCFVLLNGETGAGKTRIIEEFREQTKDTAETAFIEETCLEKDELTPFMRIVHTVFQFYKKFGALPKDCHIGNPPLTLTHEFIEFALSVYQEDTLENIFDDVESDPVQVALAVSCYLRSHCRNRTVCLLLEESHTIDRRSADFLIHFLSFLEKDDRILVIALYHGDESSGENQLQRVLPRLRQVPWFREAKIAPLLAREIPPFIQSMVGPLAIKDEQITEIYKATRGNPRHLRAFIEGLASKQCIQWQAGSWHLNIDSEFLYKLPADVEQILIKNIEKLGKHHRDILQWIAIAGRPLNTSYLSELTGLATGQLPYILVDLVREKYLLEDEEAGTYKLSSHNVTAELLVAIPDDPAKLHIAMAKVTAKLQPQEEMLATIADHYTKGEDSKKAIQYCLQAGDWAFSHTQFPMALKYYRQALPFIDKGKASIHREILEKLGFTTYHLGNYREALQHFEKASKVAGREPELANAEKGRGLCLHSLRKHSEAHTTLRKAQKFLAGGKDGEILVALADLELERWQIQKAQEYLEQAENLAGDSPVLRLLFLKNKGWVQFYNGEWQLAEESFQQACEGFVQLQQEQEWLDSLFGHACLTFYRQGVATAWPMLNKVIEVIDHSDDWYLSYNTHYYAGVFRLEQGHIKQATEHFSKVQEISKKRGNERIHGYAYLGVGLCAAQQKNLKEAEKSATRALKVGNSCSDPYVVAEAYHLLGRVYIEAKNLGLAQKYCEYSVNSWRRLRIGWKTNRIRLEYARIFALAGHYKKADEFLQKTGESAAKTEDQHILADMHYIRALSLKKQKKPAFEKFYEKAKVLYEKFGRVYSLQRLQALAKEG